MSESAIEPISSDFAPVSRSFRYRRVRSIDSQSEDFQSLEGNNNAFFEESDFSSDEVFCVPRPSIRRVQSLKVEKILKRNDKREKTKMPAIHPMSSDFGHAARSSRKRRMSQSEDFQSLDGSNNALEESDLSSDEIFDAPRQALRRVQSLKVEKVLEKNDKFSDMMERREMPESTIHPMSSDCSHESKSLKDGCKPVHHVDNQSELDLGCFSLVTQLIGGRSHQQSTFEEPVPEKSDQRCDETKNDVMDDHIEVNKIVHVQKLDDCYLATESQEIEIMQEEAKKNEYKMEIVWTNVMIQTALHIAAFIGLYYVFAGAMWQTNVWMVVMVFYATNSVTAGAHRLWTHKAYKANFWVRLFYMIGDTIAVENDVIEWARDHRCHHKWSDSDADPHNISRGFFFAHMGWLMVKKHPKVKEMGAKIDMSDLEADPILAFQRRHYYTLILITQLFLAFVPVYCWGEDLWIAYYVACALRLTVQLHGTWFINSLAHTYGYKPFDTKISPVDNYLYSILANGEAWHNYHHTFPQDYRASEYMWKANFSAMMIDFFAYMGWVWDRKTMSKEAIERQKLKGDYSRPLIAAHDD